MDKPKVPHQSENDGTGRDTKILRLLRPRGSTKPPNNYAQEQGLDIKQSNARSQRKKTQSKPVAQREVITSESSTESEDPNEIIGRRKGLHYQ
ncbi:hypothetical protein N7501_008592 [Penicillium viridicatum]|nr:hypothetical protein N7501_008592 [Penicillium viridicatum]